MADTGPDYIQYKTSDTVVPDGKLTAGPMVTPASDNCIGTTTIHGLEHLPLFTEMSILSMNVIYVLLLSYMRMCINDVNKHIKDEFVLVKKCCQIQASRNCLRHQIGLKRGPCLSKCG